MKAMNIAHHKETISTAMVLNTKKQRSQTFLESITNGFILFVPVQPFGKMYLKTQKNLLYV